MISVEFKKQTDGISYRTQSWLLTAEILSSTRTSTLKLFRIHSYNNQHFFSGVCSPADLLELPEVADATGADTYWISSKVEILCRCEDDVDEIVRLIQVDLDEFDRSLKAATTVATLGIVQVGS